MSTDSSDRPTRVSFLCNSMAAGGAETQIRWLVHSLDPKRCTPRLAWYNTDETFLPPPQHVAAAPLPRRHRFDPQFARALAQLNHRRNTDLIYAWQPTPSFYAALTRLLPTSTPVITAVQHSATLFADDAVSRHLHPLAARLGDHTTVNCRDVIPWLEERGIARDRISYMPNILPPPLLQRAPSTPTQQADVLRRMGLDPLRPPITQVARVDNNKNAIALLEAVLSLRDAGVDVPPLLLVGRLVDDALTARLRRMAKAAEYTDLHIHPPITDVPTLMEASRCVVLASRSEGTPNVVLEGMALGQIVIATRVGEVPHMIQHQESGFLCDANAVQDLATQIKDALALSPAQAKIMGAVARERILARHGPEQVLPIVYDLFDNVLQRARAPWLRPKTLLPPLPRLSQLARLTHLWPSSR